MAIPSMNHGGPFQPEPSWMLALLKEGSAFFFDEDLRCKQEQSSSDKQCYLGTD